MYVAYVCSTKYVFFANSKLILYIENKDHNNANYYTFLKIIFVLTKAYVVYRCISLMNILNEKGNCKYSIEYEKSAYSYFLITFNLSFVTQIRSEEKTKERKSHDSEKEKEDDQIQDATTYLELKVKNHFNKAMIALNSKLSLFTYLFKFHFKRISQKEEMYICRYYKN